MAELDLTYVRGVIDEVLQNRFSNRQRREVKVRHDHYQIACPVCGDSAHDDSKKRARFFFRDMKLYCYHLGCQATFTQLATGNGVYIDPIKRMEIIEYVSEHVRISRDDTDYVSKMTRSIKIDDLVKYSETPESFIINFGPVQKNSKVYKYLVNTRMLPEKRVLNEIYEGSIKITDRWFEPVAVFMNMIGDNVLSLQTRSARTGSKHFNVHTFSDLYKRVYGEEIDDIEAAIYNKIGGIFNLFSVNLDSTVTAFESYTDSLFYPNSVGGTGTNTDFTPLSDACDNVQYMFDNDEAGNNAAAKVTSTNKVFLWKKLFKDLSSKMEDSESYFKELMKIKDLNKLVQVSNIRNPYKDLKLYKYFSEDQYDKLWLPKKPFVKKAKREETRRTDKLSAMNNWETMRKDVLSWN